MRMMRAVPQEGETTMRIGTREVRLTNLDKIFFPTLGLTKGDLIQYYLDMAPYVLYQASRRPIHI
jgi:bifunctional non-homologous end joining protein LigD